MEVNQEAVNASEEEAAFLNAVVGGDVTDAIIVPEEPAAPAEEEVVEPPAAEEPVVPAALTIDDVNKLVETARLEARAEYSKIRDDLNGKLGGLTQKIESLKKSSGGWTPKAKDRLTAEFPELASLIFEDNEPEPPAPVEPPVVVPQVNIDEVVGTRVDEVTKKFEARLLKRDHPDWETVVAQDKFAAWRGTLPAEVNAQIDATWDADFLSGKITEFKAWDGEQQSKQQKQQQKQERLAAAVTPAGIPRGAGATGTEDEEEAAFKEAFNQRKRI